MLTDKKIFSVLAGARRRKKSLAGSRSAATSDVTFATAATTRVISGATSEATSGATSEAAGVPSKAASHPLRTARALRRVLARQSGVSLIWVLTVILVLLIASGAALLAVSSRFNITAIEHREQQAYYTALSTLDTVSRWIASGYESDATTAHYNAVTTLLGTVENEGGVDYPLENLDDTLGDCTLHLEYTDEGKSLELTATATFAGSVETLSMTMQRGTDPSTYDGELETEDFDTTTYDDRAAELNALTSGGVIALYEPGSTSNYYFNTGGEGVIGSSNRDILDDYIRDDKSDLEARWTTSNLLVEPSDRATSSSNNTKSNDSNVLGTQRRKGTSSGYISDWRRFMVPKNGRITIDPLERDGYEGKNASPNTAYDTSNNTRFVGLAIDGTKGKRVLFRLASDDAALGISSKNVFVSTTSDNYGKTIKNAITEKATFWNWSAPRYASLITLNFTDNTNEDGPNTVTESYDINGTTKTYPWHPNRWEKMDLFVQSSSTLDTNLVFGPFGHKDGITLDYDGTGNFREWWRGYDKEFAAQWPYVSNASNITGLPILPVDFGRNAHFWVLDSPTYQFGVRYVWFLQGTNILEGSIYSTRAVVLGGALTRISTTDTDVRVSDGLNRDLNGYADKSVTSAVNYVEATTRYSQLIYNTDIILMSPSGSNTAYSQIRRPLSWRSRTNLPTGTSDVAVFNKDTSYEPTMTIKGGTIYVGNRQSLTIQGTAKGYKNGTDYKTGNTSLMVPLDNMWISPDKIVVAAGGTLLIEKSETTNILTDIYVEGSVENGVTKGGTLNIEAGAKIKGNIYAYNGGTVNIRGEFQLLSPHDDGNNNELTEAEAKDGILIYGSQLVGRVEGIVAPGMLILPAVGPNLVTISGSSNKVHILGTVDGTTVKGVVETRNDAGAVIKSEFKVLSQDQLDAIKTASLLCNDRDPTTGACMHFGFLGGEWIGGVFMHG